MVEAGSGSIVQIASLGGSRPTIGAGAYCVSKAGVLALTKQAALEWGSSGVRVNAVSPGFMKTAMTQGRYAVPGLEEKRAVADPAAAHRAAGGGRLRRGVPLGPEAAYVTGEEILVDGGFVLTTTIGVPQPAAAETQG